MAGFEQKVEEMRKQPPKPAPKRPVHKPQPGIILCIIVIY